MLLVFFDESKNDPGYPHYHIGGVCIAEDCLVEVEELIGAISEKAFGTAELSRDTELHACDIYHRKRNFKPNPDFGFRVGLLADFAEILSREDVRLIDIQVNCDKLYDSQDPEEIAFMFFCERANDLVRSHRALGMLIGDRENDSVADRYAMTLAGYKAKGTEFAFGRDIRNLVDSVHFSHSHLSRFIQLADVYTWFLQFRNRNSGSRDDRHQAVLKIFGKEGINLFPSKYKEWPK